MSRRRVLYRLCAGVAFLLSGCASVDVPSQSSPICSWQSQVPSNANALCHATWRTLSSIVRAEVRGDNATIRRLVVAPAVADHIIRYGSTVRRQHVNFLHVVPSYTLEVVHPREVGAAFYLVGQTPRAKISRPQTVYLAIRGSQALVVRDQSDQDW